MTTKQNNRPDAFPPGEFIHDELEARGWEPHELAERMGQLERVVSELIASTQSVTEEIAKQLSAAFGTSAELWLNLEATYRRGGDGAP